MEKINDALRIKQKKASDAIETLRLAIEDLETSDTAAKAIGRDPERMYKSLRDSLIQRFEYTFDLTWKYLLEHLKEAGMKIFNKYPKIVFREALKGGTLSADETRVALDMVDDRNLTTHGSDEELIEKISAEIPKYYKLMNDILQRLS